MADSNVSDMTTKTKNLCEDKRISVLEVVFCPALLPHIQYTYFHNSFK